MTNTMTLLTAPFLHNIPNSVDLYLPYTSLDGITVAEWMGSKKPKKHNTPIVKLDTKDLYDPSWKDVYKNIKYMDQLYDASFHSWLKSEDNVLVTSMYLHRIANEYPLSRMINALQWLTSEWRLESINTLIRSITVDWCDQVGKCDQRRAHLLRHLTCTWATQYTTTLLNMILTSTPYVNSTDQRVQGFLRAFTKDWDFSKLSEFFMYLQCNIDCKVKCIMLQEAAQRESVKKLNHKREQNDMKRLRLSKHDMV